MRYKETKFLNIFHLSIVEPTFLIFFRWARVIEDTAYSFSDCRTTTTYSIAHYILSLLSYSPILLIYTIKNLFNQIYVFVKLAI